MVEVVLPCFIVEEKAVKDLRKSPALRDFKKALQDEGEKKVRPGNQSRRKDPLRMGITKEKRRRKWDSELTKGNELGGFLTG